MTKDVRQLLDGYRATCAILAAYRIGLLGALEGGRSDVSELAEETGSVPGALNVLLRALESLDIVTISRVFGGRVSLTPSGKALMSEGLQSALCLLSEDHLSAWVQLGRSPLGEVADSAWDRRRSNPEVSMSFNLLMRSSQADGYEGAARQFNFSRHREIVDVGGGHGQFLASVLRGAPDSCGVLLDLPHVVDEAVRDFFPGLPASVSSRISPVGGSFFELVPDGDLHVLRNVLHDWGDEACVKLLRACRESLRPGGRILLIEETRRDASVSVDSAMRDLHLLAVHGGRSRSVTELSALLGMAGLRVSAHYGFHMLEACSDDGP